MIEILLITVGIALVLVMIAYILVNIINNTPNICKLQVLDVNDGKALLKLKHGDLCIVISDNLWYLGIRNDEAVQLIVQLTYEDVE